MITDMRITIIGAGPGGYETALEAAGRGVEVTLVSDGPVGGTCLNEGCIPTKALCRNAEVLETLASASSYGVEALAFGFDYRKVIERKDQTVTTLRSGVEFLLKSRKVNLVYGKASLAGPHEVKVALRDGGETSLESDFIIVATGSVPAWLPVPGADLEGVVDSSGILSMTEVPRRLCVIGGGVIGLEFASVFKSFGSQVTVLEYFPEIIPRFDKDIAKRLKQSLSKRGIEIITSAKVEGVSSTADGLSVSYVRKDETLAVCADKVLMAVGRRPALGSLDFASVGIETDRAVKVNSYMQTSVPSIYAIGDITGGWMLAHAATFQGLRALNHILAGQPSDGPVDSIRLDLVPAAVFTVPEVAVVGFSEEDCKERGIAFKAHKSFFRANGKALAMGEPEGLCKILVSSGSEEFPAGEILGCHIMGAHAADLVQEVCTLMNSHGTIGDLGAVIHSHPTLSEVVLSAARG